MNLLTYLRECQRLLRWHFFRMLSKTSPSSVQLKCWMNTPLPPLGMGHSLTSTNYPTTISSSMHVLGMMPPTHQPIRREEMYMLLLAPRISPLLRNTTNHSSLKTQKPHQMTSIKYIKPNIEKAFKTTIWVPEGLCLNILDLFMFLQKFTNFSALKQLLPSRNTILRPSTYLQRNGTYT